MNTFWIFRTEMRRLLRSRIGRAAIVVGIIIPLLYSGLYLYAFWDPYNQMQDYPVALVNLDHGGEKDGKHVDYGKDLVDELVKNNAVGWRVVSEEEANRGLEKDGYYLKVTIPATFTEDALSVTGDTPKRAEVLFTQNEGKNYIASTISKRVETSLREEVGNKFSKEYIKGIFDVIGDAGNGLSQAADGANKLADGANQVHDGTVSAVSGSKQLADGAAKLKDGSQQVADGNQQLSDGLKQANGGATQLKDGANTLHSKLGDVSKGVDAILPNLQTTTGGIQELQGKLSQSIGDTDRLQGGLLQMQGYLGQVDDKGQPVPSGTTDPTKMSAASLLSLLAQKYNFANDPLYAGVLKNIGGVSANLGQAATQVSSSKTGLNQAVGALGQIADGQGQMIAGMKQLSDGSKQLQTGAGDLAKGISDLQAGTQTMATKSVDLAAGAKQVADGNASLATGSHDLATGTVKLEDGAKQVADGNKELASKLTDATKDSTIKNPDAKADIMADPVHTNYAPLHPVTTYGMGFASYFIPLSLWVGAVVLYFILSMKEYRWIIAPVSSSSIVLGKFLTLGVIGIAQTVISGLVLTKGLGLTVLHPVQFYLMMILLSFVSISIIGILIARLGSGPGRFFAILLLILQLTSSAGTFPIEMVPNFFKAIHPFLPMSYGIEGLRAIIATGDQSLINKDFIVLGSIFVVVLLVQIVTTRRSLRIGDLHDKDVLQG